MTDFSSLPELPSFISRDVLVWGIFGFALIIFTGYTIILLYHWSRYAEKKSVFSLALTIYAVVSGLILTGVILSTILLLTQT